MSRHDPCDRGRRGLRRPGGGSRALAFALLVLCAPSARAEDVRDIARVQKLYLEGRSARERGDLERALALLLGAWSIRKTPDIAASLAQVEFELGRPRDAAEHLAYACRHLPADADPRRVRRLLDALERVEQKVVVLRIEVEPKQAEVRLNDRALGRGEALEHEIYADPGSLALVAELAGFAPARAEFVARAGERRRVRLALSQLGGSAAARTAAPPRGAAPSWPNEGAAGARSSTAPSWMAFGVSGAALVASASFWLAADARGRAAERKLAELPGVGRCGSGTPFAFECAGVRDELAAERGFRVVSVVSLGVAVSSALAGVLLWPEDPTPWQVQGGVEITPSASRGELELRF
jgi:hypothetical protein